MVDTASINQRLCSLFSSENGETPFATATNCTQWLFIELKEPWEKDIEKSKHFPKEVSSVLKRVRGRGNQVRLQCILPDSEYSVDGYTRVIYFSLDEGASIFQKKEYLLKPVRVASLVEALLVEPKGLKRFDAEQQAESTNRDIFVCTHGKYDVCCGRFGYLAYQTLRTNYGSSKENNLRVWRVSHLGGHRFAPNILDMPEGNNWARMSQKDLGTIIIRDEPVSEIRHCYRGWVALASPEEQMLESEAFMREGWDWTRRRVFALPKGQDVPDANGNVRVKFSEGDVNRFGNYQAVVECVGKFPSINCITGNQSAEYPKYEVKKIRKLRSIG